MNCGLDKKQLDALRRIYKRRGDEAVRKMCEDLGYSYEKVLEDIMGNVVSVAPSSFVGVKEVSHYEGYNPKTSDKTNNIVSYYAESTSRYNKMLADFSRDIISETFLEINSERFAFKNPSGFNLKNRTTNLNANITSYKIRLANELYSILRSDNDFTILESDDGLIKESKLQSILQLYWDVKDSLTKEKNNNALDYYIKLKYFDDLVKNIGFISIDSKYSSSNNSFVNKYKYEENSVEQYSGFSNDQYMDALKATSPLAKIILNYIPEINYHVEQIPNSSIGTNGFNYVTQRLKDWVESSHPKDIQDIINSEKRKGTNMDLGVLIDLWLRHGTGITPLMRNKLNSIRRIIFGKNNGNFILPNNLRNMFTHMYEKTVSTSYIQYTKKDNDVSPSSLTENVVNMSKFRLIDSIIGASVYWNHNKSVFNSIYNDYTNKRINIYDAINKTLFLNITPLFDEYNSLVNTVSSESLLEGIFTQLYKYVNSQVGTDDIIIQEVRKSLNDKNNKRLQSILINTSKVLSSIETSGIKSVIKNNEGNSLPLNQMICLAYLHKDIVNRIEKQDTGDYNPYEENLCYKNIDNIEKPLIRSEVSVNGKTKPANQLSVGEVLNVAIVDDFLYNLLNENESKQTVLGFQTNCFSDKSKYFVTQFNISKRWNDHHLKELLLDVVKNNNKTSIETLKSIWRESWNKELTAKYNNILSDYKEVFDLHDKSDNEILEFVNNYFKIRGKHGFIAKFAAAGIDCVEEIHYSSGGFNNTLLYLLSITSDKNKFDKYVDDQLYNLSQELSSGGDLSAWNHLAQRPIVRGLFSDDWVKMKDDILSEPKGEYDPESGKVLKGVVKVKTPLIVKGEEYNPLLVGYFLAHNILAESYNRLMYGDLWAHPNKAKDKTNPIESLASRWVAQTKRLVIAGATYHSYAQGLKYGVDDEINVAVVEDRSASVHNTNGDEDQGLDSMDGAGFVSPYYSMQSNYSLIDASAGGNKKTIFHDINGKFGNARLLKWAEYALSNNKRRESIRSAVSAENLFKKAHNKSFDLDAKRRIADNARYNPNSVTYYDPSRDIYIKISSANFSLNGENLVVRLVTNDVDNPFKELNINNIYDLDQAFGGCWAVKYNDQTKEYDYSEDNISVVNGIICECGLKSYMISYIINKSAMKVGWQNLNNKDRFIDDKPFLTFKLSTKFGGVQMDADHTLEDSESTEPTQMLSALAQNGYSQDVVRSAYESLAELAMDSISKYTEALSSGDHEALYDIVKKSVIAAFETGNRDVIGLAQEFIANAKKLGSESGYKIPFSSSSINGIFTSTLMSDFTKKGIRRKYSGMGGVLNPSYDMMTYYEFEGKKVKYSELLHKLYKYAKRLNIIKAEGDTRDVIDILFNDIELNTDKGVILNPFKSEEIDEMNPIDFEGTYIIHNHPIILGENISESGETELVYQKDKYENIVYLDKDGNETVEKYSKITIKTMKDFLTFRNNSDLTLTKDSLAPINLRGLDIEYTVKGLGGYIKYSHLENPYSVAMYLLKQNKFNSFIPKNDIQDIAIDLINSLSYLKSDNSKLKELRKQQQAYFANIKPGDDFFGLGIIQDIYTRPAEIMMGRIYAKELGLTMNDNISDVTGPEYFEDKMSNYYRIDNPDKDAYDFILFDGSGRKLYIKYGSAEGFNLKANDDYKDIEGTIFNDNTEICSNVGKKFYKHVASNGSLYDLCVIDSLDRLNEIINTSHWNNVVRNYTVENFSYMYNDKLNNEWSEESLERSGQKTTRLFYLDKGKIKYYDLLNADMIDSPNDDLLKKLNDDSLIKMNRRIKNIAKNKYYAFVKSLEFVGTRIPCQSMQSFAPMRVVAFADTDINECYIPSHISWVEGSDYDIDKQYIIGYSLLKDGTMPNSFKSTNNSFIKDVITRNKIIDAILTITKDPRNNLNLTTPVSTKTLQDISATSPLGELSKIMNPSNPASIYQMQIENGVGKSTIGVAATGVKAFYNLTYYYNNGWLDVKKLCELGEYDKAYSLALELSISNIKNDNKDRTLVDANLLIFDDEFMESLSVNSKVLYDLIDTIKKTNYQMSDASLAAGELINASTDNAKELILKKINADASFMDIYIAGLTLGFNLNQISTIMMDSDVNSLIRESGANIFTEQIRTSYKRKLKGSLGLIKNYRGDKVKVTENIILFNKLLDVSEEFNMLGKMTSINQGIPTDKFDLYNLIYSVNKYFNGTEDEPTGMNFDLMRFFTDDDYAKDQIAIYETQKRSFNILKSLYNNPLMNSLYKILCTAVQTSNALSKRNHLEYELFGIQDISSRESYADLRDNISKTFDIDFVSSKDISFVVPAGVSIITDQGPVVLSESKQFNIESVFDLVGSNIATFKSYMEQYYIPKLKELYPDNRFIQDLTFGVHIFDGKDSIYYKLPLNMMEVGSNPQSTELYEEYSKGFFDLIGQTLDDNNILDMFYIYNLFANKTFSQSSLTRLFSDLVSLNKAESLVVSHNHWFDNQDMDYLLSTFTNESLEPTVYNTPVKSSNNKAYSLNVPKETLLDSIFDNPEIWGANISHVHKLTKETINEVLNSYGLSDDYISSHNLDTAKAFVYNGDIFINTDLGNDTDLVHELSHWLIALMKQNKNGYLRLREVYDRIKSTKMYNRLKDYHIYTDLNNDDFCEEVLAHLIADDIKWVKVLGIKLPKNDTVEFVKQMLDPNYEIGINTEQFIKIRSSQKIAELRNQLIEDDKIIEDCK